MSWTRIDDSYDSNAKILALGNGAKGDARRWTWTRILIHSHRHGTPEIPPYIQESIRGATRAFLNDCVELGLVDEEPDGNLCVHDWIVYSDADVSEKVSYILDRSPEKSANQIQKEIGARRGEVLSEVKRQRDTGSAEPGIPVPGNHDGNHSAGSAGGTLPTRPDPTRPEKVFEGSPVSEISPSILPSSTTPRERPTPPREPADHAIAHHTTDHDELDIPRIGTTLERLQAAHATAMTEPEATDWANI